jgi:hypothetical protein
MRPLLPMLLAVSLFSVVSCGDDQDPEGAKDLLQSVRDDDYTSWARAPGYEGREPSSAPHGDQVEIFMNDVVEQALAAGDALSEWPVGSVIAKDGYTDDGELELIAIMEKRDDGWYWAEYDGEGESIYSGKPSVCIDCHASGSDYVRAFSLPR